ncbi:MAG: tetratricopeptide repeat protein [Crocinitomicaceae bacterium]|nr:tetratricopeptide repeat protein [Crocinitomicaceae bacterium]
MKINRQYLLMIFTTVALLSACSTEKNTGINRAYHYVTARYNGNFNANELIDVSLATYRDNLSEDYYNLLPIEAIPSEAEIESFYPALDTAIAKVKIVLADHSMPTLDKPSRKDAEHNNYIDENWITIGRAFYYRRDYDIALKNFKFINKYFSNDPSNYVGEIWMAKTNIRVGNYTDAKLSLDKVEKVVKSQEEKSKDKSSKSGDSKSKKSAAAKLNKKGSSKKEKDSDKIAKFPKKMKFEFERTKADLAVAKQEYPKAIEYLENALKEAKKSQDKGRVNFILGQLYEQDGNNGSAIAKYKKSTKYKIPYPMSFSAQLKTSILDGGPKIKKSLNKMLKDAKNAEFKDQIYYSIAMIDLREGNENKAMENLTNSAFYSTTNIRQKGMAYEKMGDLSYAKRNYVNAQKYYDSCATTVDDNYPKIAIIRSKAEKLKDLVVAVETAQYEDSVQRIAKMDPTEQEKFLQNVIKKQEEEAAAKAKRDAEKLRELAKNNNAFQQDMNAKGGGYWGNSNSVNEGAIEFQKRWGNRANEDHWRRSEKTISMPTTSTNVDDTTTVSGVDNNVVNATVDKPTGPTVESLAEGLPKSESDFNKSNQRLVEALYNAGVIYKEQLQEPQLAKTQFESILSRGYESDYNLMAAFQLYKMYEKEDPTKAYTQKEYILTNYPNSDYANYLKDPDYFVKKKEMDALHEQEYVTVLNRYNRKVYYPVISKAENVMENEPDNVYRSKYMLLLAMSKGQLSDNKQEIVPILERIVKEYTGSDEAKRAQEMLDIISNGYSKSEPAVFGNKTIYTYEEGAPCVVLIFLDPSKNIDLSKTKVFDFTREFFPKSHAKVTTNVFGSQNLIMVAEFQKEFDAKEYVSTFKKTKKYLLDLRESKTVIISPKNLKLLFETKELDQYETFYYEYY